MTFRYPSLPGGGSQGESRTVLVAASVGASGLAALALSSVSLQQSAIILFAIVIITIAITFLLAVPLIQIQALLLYATCATLPLTGVKAISWVTVGDVFLVLSLIAILPAFLEASLGNRLRPYQTLLLGTLLLCIGSLLGTFYSENPFLSLVELAKLVLASVILPIFVAVWSPNVRQHRAMAAALVVGTAVSSLVAVLEPLHTYNDRADGLAAHFNHLGLSIVLALPMAFALFRTSWRLRHLLWIAAILAMLGGLSQSGSRAAFLGTGLAALLYFVVIRNRFVPFALAAGAILLSFAAPGLSRHLPAGSALTRLSASLSQGLEQSDQGRLELIRGSLETSLRSPIFGSGLFGAGEAHNVYLQIWQAAGLFGVVGILLVALATVVQPLRLLRHFRLIGSWTDLGIAALTSSVFGFFVTDAFQNAIWDRYIWLVLVLAVSAKVNFQESYCVPAPQLIQSKKAQAASTRRPSPIRPEHA